MSLAESRTTAFLGKKAVRKARAQSSGSAAESVGLSLVSGLTASSAGHTWRRVPDFSGSSPGEDCQMRSRVTDTSEEC